MIIQWWTIKELRVLPEYNGHQQVVASVQWMQATQTSGSQSLNYGWSHLPLPNPGDSFVPYDQLTREQLVEWAQELHDPRQLYEWAAESIRQVANMEGYVAQSAELPWAGGE